MVAINVVPDQNPLLSAWLREGGYSFDVLIGARTEQIFRDYGMSAAPLNFLLDSEGKILARYDGYRPGAEAEIEERVRVALGL